MSDSKRTEASNWVKDHRGKRKAAGLCIECGKPAGQLRCEECLARNREAAKKNRERKRAIDACSLCGGKRDGDKKLCSECTVRQSDYRKRNYDKNAEENKCVSCGKEAEANQRRCLVCKKKSNGKNQRRREKYTAEGRCRDCGGESQLSSRSMRGRDRGSYCRDCYFKVMAVSTLGSRSLWQVLIDKLDACGWRCPYTGELLIPGVNLSFDHMDPICRFPEKRHDHDNIEPISWKINLMKRDLTKSEFLLLIEIIHSHTKKR